MFEDLSIKEISDDEYIYDLFRKLARMRNMLVTVNYDGIEIDTMLEFKDRKGNEFYIKIKDAIGKSIKISFSQNGYIFYFVTTLTNDFLLAKPEIIYLFSQRELERYIIPENDEIFVLIDAQKYKLINMHTKGLAFETNKKIFKSKEILRDALIILKNTQFYADIDIRYLYKKSSKSYIYGVIFKDIHWLDKLNIIKYILNNKFGHLQKMTEFSKEEVYELFEKSGYLDLNEKGMQGNFDKMIEILHKIDSIPHISKSFVYANEQNKILSGANIVKIYNNTFLAQHLASIREARFNFKCKSDLYEAIINYLLNYENFKYYLAYFEENLQWHKTMYRKICEFINNSNIFNFSELHTFVITIPTIFKDTEKKYEIKKMYDKSEFLEYARQNIIEIERECYCYNDNIELSELKTIYELSNLYFKRNIYKISYKNSLIAYVVAESASSGLNMFNIFDSSRVYFVNTQDLNLNDFFYCILFELSKFYSLCDKKHYFMYINTSYNLNFDNLQIEGLHKSMISGRVIATRKGTIEYNKYFKTIMSEA